MEAIGRIPPHSIEAEVGVLGAMMLSRDAVVEASEVITKDDFYRESHKILFEVMMELFERNEPVDLVTVTDALRSKDLLEVVGGLDYVADLPMNVISTSTVPYYAKMIKDKATLRRLIESSGRVAELGYGGGSVDEVLEEAERSIFLISESRVGSGLLSLRDILPESLDMIDKLQRNKGSISGVPSGYSDLDSRTSGFQPSDLVLVAARPSMGKTAFALNIAHNVAVREKKSVAIFSLEMSKEQLTNRLICSEANIDSQKLRMGMLEDEDWPKLTRAVGVLSQAPIYIDDTPNITVPEMRGKLRRLKMEKGLDLVIIDYLQLMESDKKAESRQQEVSSLSRELKGLARELNVPIITLSQLSRAPEARSDHRPMLSDLRECVTGDTLVILADGTRIPIRDLVDTRPEVFSLDQYGKIIKAKSDKVWYVGKRPVFDVILASGRHIRATAKHRLLSGTGWKTILELNVGDRIACARKIPEPDSTESWPEYRIALLGQLIGDGSYLVHQPMRFTTASEENSEIVATAATTEFGTIVKRYSGRGNWHQLLLSGNGNRWHPSNLNLWLRELGIFGQRSYEKRIPFSAFKLSNKQISLLLRHLWATDGTISPRTNSVGSDTIGFSTCSEKLAFDVAALLLRLGIYARIYKNNKEGYRTVFNVTVSGVDAQRRFLEIVGAFGPRVKPAMRLKEKFAMVANTNVDTLPIEVFAYIKKRMREEGISQRKMAAIRGTSYGGAAHFGFAPSRDVVAQYSEILNDKQLKNAANSDLFWDRIVNIVPSGEEDVYDITVPDTSSWLADGIVSHNSGAIEQDADVVMFLYREDYYEPDTDKKNITEVILAKQRNGPTGTIELYWLPQYTKFVGLEKVRRE